MRLALGIWAPSSFVLRADPVINVLRGVAVHICIAEIPTGLKLQLEAGNRSMTNRTAYLPEGGGTFQVSNIIRVFFAKLVDEVLPMRVWIYFTYAAAI